MGGFLRKCCILDEDLFTIVTFGKSGVYNVRHRLLLVEPNANRHIFYTNSTKYINNHNGSPFLRIFDLVKGKEQQVLLGRNLNNLNRFGKSFFPLDGRLIYFDHEIICLAPLFNVSNFSGIIFSDYEGNLSFTPFHSLNVVFCGDAKYATIDIENETSDVIFSLYDFRAKKVYSIRISFRNTTFKAGVAGFYYGGKYYLFFNILRTSGVKNSMLLVLDSVKDELSLYTCPYVALSDYARTVLSRCLVLRNGAFINRSGGSAFFFDYKDLSITLCSDKQRNKRGEVGDFYLLHLENGVLYLIDTEDLDYVSQYFYTRTYDGYLNEIDKTFYISDPPRYQGCPSSLSYLTDWLVLYTSFCREHIYRKRNVVRHYFTAEHNPIYNVIFSKQDIVCAEPI